jgi:hypothetical protein
VVLTHGSLPKGNNTAAVSFSIPETAYGNYFVQFFQVTRDAVNDQFKVLPGIFAVPATVAQGATVVIRGTGFPAGDTGTAYLKNSTSSAQLTTNSVGSFSVNLPVPDLASGNYIVSVTTSRMGADAATTNINVVSRSSIELVDPQLGQQNNNNGNGSIPTTTPPAPSNNGGSIIVGNGVPTNQPQTPRVTPAKPVILSPREESIGTLGSQPVTFKWGPVFDPKGITYNLEVNDNFGFEPPVSAQQVKKLSGTSYTMQLEPGTYYWRVKAVDGSGNEGAWSYSPYPFKVSDFPIVPIVIGVVVMIALVFLIRGLFRGRRDDYDDGGYYYQ